MAIGVNPLAGLVVVAYAIGSLVNIGITGLVGEEYQRQTTGKYTRTTTYLQGLVAKDIPCKADTRRNLDTVVGPCASIDSIAVEAIDLLPLASLKFKS